MATNNNNNKPTNQPTNKQTTNNKQQTTTNNQQPTNQQQPSNKPTRQTKKQLNNSGGNINNIVMAINDKTTIITCSTPQKIDKAICQCVASQPIVNPRARSKSTNLRTALTMGTPPHKSGANLRTAVFCDFFLKSNSLQSRAHSKKRSDRDSCLTF
jgi:uncharacterized FlaG/YvyC family protein